ncbi:MAG TPA: HEAT repeat domain-containing protein [bacterium]|nr:HEAT repeat domain-containing protein [bacterium]
MKSAILCITLALLITACISCGKQQEQEVVVYKGKTLDQWIEQVQTGGYRSCIDAMMAIGACGPAASRAKSLLQKIQKEPDFQSFGQAAKNALIRIDPKAKDAVPGLIEKLRSNQDHKTRVEAMAELGNIGPSAASAAPELIQIIRNDEDDVIRMTAATALGRIGTGGEQILPELLVKMRESKDSLKKNGYIRTIGCLGDQARPAVPELLALLSSENWGVRGRAAMALKEIGSPTETIVPAIRELLKDKESSPRQIAAMSLGYFIPPEEATVQALIKALQDGDTMVRCLAAGSLGSLGEYARAALPALKLLALQRTTTGVKPVDEAPAEAIKRIEYRMPGRE